MVRLTVQFSVRKFLWSFPGSVFITSLFLSLSQDVSNLIRYDSLHVISKFVRSGHHHDKLVFSSDGGDGGSRIRDSIGGIIPDSNKFEDHDADVDNSVRKGSVSFPIDAHGHDIQTGRSIISKHDNNSFNHDVTNTELEIEKKENKLISTENKSTISTITQLSNGNTAGNHGQKSAITPSDDSSTIVTHQTPLHIRRSSSQAFSNSSFVHKFTAVVGGSSYRSSTSSKRSSSITRDRRSSTNAAVSTTETVTTTKFCQKWLYSTKIECDDGTALPAFPTGITPEPGFSGCCPDTDTNTFGCPSTCTGERDNKWVDNADKSDYIKICKCQGCPPKRKLTFPTPHEQYTKAHNYFRCLHYGPDMQYQFVFDQKVEDNARKGPLEQSCMRKTLSHAVNPESFKAGS